MVLSLSMPADFSAETLKAYASARPSSNEYDVRVTETYGCMNPEVGVPSARSAVAHTSPKVSRESLAEYIRASHEHGIAFNYTYNGTLPGSFALRPMAIAGALRIIEDLCRLGVDSLTVTNTSLLLNIRHAFPHLPVGVSVVSYVDSTSKALWYARTGVRRITLPEVVNRDFAFLANCASLPVDISLQLNAKCTVACPMRREHYEFLSSLGPVHPNAFGRFFTDNCNLIRHSAPWDILRSTFIRPEDLPIYARHGVTHFKFVGREWAGQADHVRVYDAYRAMRFDGDIYELLHGFRHRDVPRLSNRALDGFLEHFVKNRPNCRTDCEVQCLYCRDYYDRLKSDERWSPRPEAQENASKDVEAFLEAGRRLYRDTWTIESTGTQVDAEESNNPLVQIVNANKRSPLP
jgi:collagenase-like PrtC family protease